MSLSLKVCDCILSSRSWCYRGFSLKSKGLTFFPVALSVVSLIIINNNYKTAHKNDLVIHVVIIQEISRVLSVTI
jgi:hypothetical protein